MRFCRFLLIQLFTFCSLAALASSDSVPEHALFHQLIEESGLRFVAPAGFTDIALEENPVLSYERAVRHASGALEIRYIIRPLGRLSIDYNDPHNAAPEPNHLFPLLFASLTNELSSGGNTPSSEYPQSQANELFNAGLASAAVFDVNPDFSTTYRQALLLGIHRDNQADAYSVFLFNEYSQVREAIQGALSSLSFAP